MSNGFPLNWLNPFFWKDIQLNGTPLPSEGAANFVGGNWSITDNPANGTTDIALSTVAVKQQATLTPASTLLLTTGQTGTHFLLDSRTGPFTVVLPNPGGGLPAGTFYRFTDRRAQFSPSGSNNVTLDGNGNSLRNWHFIGDTGSTASTVVLDSCADSWEVEWEPSGSGLWLMRSP